MVSFLAFIAVADDDGAIRTRNMVNLAQFGGFQNYPATLLATALCGFGGNCMRYSRSITAEKG